MKIVFHRDRGGGERADGKERGRERQWEGERKRKRRKAREERGKYEHLGIKRDKAKNLAQQDRAMATK